MIISEMQHKLATWAAADQTRRFDRLLRLITDRNWLGEAARIVLASKGANTPGLDGMDKRRLAAALERHLDRLRVVLLDGTYRPTPVKRIHIPKANGKLSTTGYTDPAGPHRPAGDVDGHGADLGERLPLWFLRLPSRTQCSELCGKVGDDGLR